MSADEQRQRVAKALDGSADALFGARTTVASSPFAEAIVVGLRRASVLIVAEIFGDEESRRAAHRAQKILADRS